MSPTFPFSLEIVNQRVNNKKATNLQPEKGKVLVNSVLKQEHFKHNIIGFLLT